MKTVLSSMVSDAHVADDGTALNVALTSGRALKLPLSPSPGDPPTEDKLPSTARGICRAVSAFAEIDRALHAIAYDADLTAQGREKKLREPRANALRAFAKAYEDGVVAHSVSTDAFEAQLYALPRVESSNYPRERHIVDMILAAPTDRHAALMQHVLNGDDEEAAVALQRAPKIVKVLLGDDRFEKLATTAWKALIEKRKPDEVQTLRLARELNAWGERAFAILAGEMSLTGRNGHYLGEALQGNRQQIYELTAAGRAHRLFGIQDDEAARFDSFKQRSAR